MKKNLQIKLINLLAVIMFLLVLPIKTYAYDYTREQIQNKESSEVQFRAEETGYIYKIMNGKQYKRLWSYTYARWIDKDWTLA